jgi:hypothetical protein
VHRPSLCVAAAVMALWATGCHKGQIRMQVAPGSWRHEWRDPLVPEDFQCPASDLLYLVEPPVGFAPARQRPLEGFLPNARLRWNDSVKPLCRYFDLLCREHNQAALTVQGFVERRDALLVAAADVSRERQSFEEMLGAFRASETHLAQARAVQGEADRDQIERVQAEIEVVRDTADRMIRRVAERVRGLEPAPNEPAATAADLNRPAEPR